ncbi:MULTISPECIES: hypothetical protein [Aphanothece]|uniref:hypothetical protein n=1 Tax=Aphanothece TaxID=1121 RepID=UPI003985310B
MIVPAITTQAVVAIAAVQLSHSLRLPMTGIILFAAARIHQARFYTVDTDFKGLNDVEAIAKQG